MKFAHSITSAEANRTTRSPTGVPDLAFATHMFDNGLRLVVHEDRSTPRVAVEVRYDVGAKDEPVGYTGFAHLFEHLMFKGSANRPGGWHKAMHPLGATNVNGSTNYDRTNFYQTVPKAALDRVLWMEADRMGFVLQGVDAKSLADEIEVVKNEKRQTTSGGGAETSQYLRDILYPRSHPYGHHVIGDEVDLDQATLDRAAYWHKRWYGPSNAVIALVGDIDFEEAKERVGHWFGDLPAGPPLQRELRNLPISTGCRRVRCEVELPHAQLMMMWHCGGITDPDGPLLGYAASILGSGPRARLRKRLVDRDRLCLDASASHGASALCGLFSIDVTLAPDADVDRVETIIAEELERFRVDGPAMAELEEARRNGQQGYTNALESIEFKAAILSGNMLTFGGADGNRYLMERSFRATPQDVRDVFANWCAPDRQAVHAEVVPVMRASLPASTDRSTPPPIGDIHAPALPPVLEHRLENGLKILFVQRASAPQIHSQLVFSGGTDVDPDGKEGLTRLALALMAKAKKNRSVDEYDASLRALRLGVGMAVDQDAMSVSMAGPPENLRELMAHAAEFVLEPAFLAADFEFLHANMVTGEKRIRLPEENRSRALDRFSFGHLKEQSLASVQGIRLTDIVSRYEAWMDPATSVLCVAGNVDMDAVVAAVRDAFGAWRRLGPALPTSKPQIGSEPGSYLVSAPGEQQTALSIRCLDDRLRSAIDVEAATVYAQCVKQRLSDKLRGPGWTYWAGCSASMHPRVGFLDIFSSVQADRTADALEIIEDELQAIATSRPITQEEFDQVQSARILGLLNNWVDCQSIVHSLASDWVRGRSPGHAATLEERVRSVTLDEAQEIAGWFCDKARLVTVAYGDPKWLPAGRFRSVSEADF